VIVRALLVSRRARAYAAVIAALALLSLVLGRTGVLINLEIRRPDVRLPFSEICAVLAGACGAVLLRPRFWEWDRVGTSRAAVVASACAVVGILTPVLVVAVGATRLPDDFAVAWRLSNAVVLCAVTFLAAPFLGSAVASALVVLLYFVHGLVNNLWLDLGFVPITRFPETGTHWLAALALTAGAAAVHYRTRGASAWAQRTFSRDE
jgi:hypothetical protein